MEIAIAEILVFHQLYVKWNSGLYAFNDKPSRATLHFGDALLVFVPKNEFWRSLNHKRGYGITRVNMRIYPHTMPFGCVE